MRRETLRAKCVLAADQLDAAQSADLLHANAAFERVGRDARKPLREQNQTRLLHVAAGRVNLGAGLRARDERHREDMRKWSRKGGDYRSPQRLLCAEQLQRGMLFEQTIPLAGVRQTLATARPMQYE